MAEIFDTKVRKFLTNQAASQVNAPVIVNCWLEEGDITVTSANTLEMKSRMNTQKAFSWASASMLGKGNKVSLLADVAFLYASLLGKPIVSTPATTSGIVGEILDYPEPLQYQPSSTTAANSIAKRVAGRFYRLAPVRFDYLGYETVPVDGTVGGPIAVGDRLTYDISSAVYIKDAGAASPLVSCHYSAAASTNVGALRLPGIVTTQA